MGMDKQLIHFETHFRPIIDAFLVHQLKQDVDQKRLEASMQYSITAGGKRLRPLLTLAVLTTLGVDIDADRLKAVCAVELLHTYSLIHDDLPAMDNDDLRRGKPTNHVQFGAGMATLAGDGLLTLAFQWLVDNQLPAELQTKLVLDLSRLSGPAGMVAGQADDIFFEKHQLTLTELQRLHRNKTGALILYSVRAGRLLAFKTGVEDDWDQFAAAFGLAFQIYDDILDVTSSSRELGKPVHQDQFKNTYPNLIGLQRSYQALNQIIADGRSALRRIQATHHLDVGLLDSFFSYFQI